MDYPFVVITTLLYLFAVAFTGGGLWIIFYGKEERPSWPLFLAALLFPITIIVLLGFMFGALVFDKKGGL